MEKQEERGIDDTHSSRRTGGLDALTAERNKTRLENWPLSEYECCRRGTGTRHN